ncbi:acetate--CoA ligase family protein [Roseovarius sp. ZX-A-9]|uniref:acetate--CoA ligase family protein n=1 Tax=Roseovarius sp. ZX-A-9 TaxID=3014783 RepID=UPI00232A87C2|nr:acetate--CoA ligase family protein [Roseovarius sp. ZX-A-9]
MTRDLTRLIRPRSIAVVGGGVWCASVIEQCQRMGFDGAIWPVHPKRGEVGGVATFASVADLPGVPDATFIGVNRTATIDIVRALSEMGAGGAVCFASGFREAQAETGDGDALQGRLLQAAGTMPIIGPNCYGLINYLDGALLWPDQHGGVRVDRGVALITQSSNIAINVSMQARGLPLAYVATAGNQAQTGLAELGQALLEDSRVTALGLHIEGVGDLRAFEALASKARVLGKPIVALKAGKSEQARAATVSHTASLAGSDAGATALLRRLGIAQVHSLPVLLETLKLMHFAGLPWSDRMISISCSGGEASLVADAAVGRGVSFPPLNDRQRTDLRAALGPMVALANPLDYHTFIWNDVPAMAATFTAALRGDLALGCLIVDYPRTDRCSDSAWACTIAAGKAAHEATGVPVAIVASLPENMPEAKAAEIAAAGLIPMVGIDEVLSAFEAARGAAMVSGDPAPLLLPGSAGTARVLTEADSKAALAEYGLRVPRNARAGSEPELSRAAHEIGLPLVLKGEGIAHKTEAGAVAVGLQTPAEVIAAASVMKAQSYLVEEMITGGVAELLIGVVCDPAHGYVLTVAAGGILTEILQDAASLLVPATEAEIGAALDGLRIAPLLRGYRGKPAADRAAIIAAIMAVQAYTLAQGSALEEVEVNPLICTPDGAVAADALIRTGETT